MPKSPQDDNKFEKYGHRWPLGTTDVTIELWCYKVNLQPEDGGLGNTAHMINAISLLWPEKMPDGRKGFIFSPWTFRRIKAWCEPEFVAGDENWQTWWGPAASGKAQPLDATVYTPRGPVEMGSLIVGDTVLSQDGNTAKVIRVIDRGVMDCYRVRFSDGTSTRCAGDHLWTISCPNNKWRRSKVVETSWIKNQLDVSHSKYQIPLCEPVYFEKRATLIDPYVMGVLLGDGMMGGKAGTTSLGFTSADSEVVDRMNELIPETLEVVPEAQYQYRIVKRSRKNNGANEYNTALKHYGLWSKLSLDKFVPTDYLFNSRVNRRELLSGLLDTDGTVSRTGAVSFASISKNLADSVVFLVQSLGGIARVTTKKPYYRDDFGKKIYGHLCYNVSINLPDELDIFKIKRKSERLHLGCRGVERHIVGVELEPPECMRCITVDHPSGLYLTNDFIVTHNSCDAAVIVLVDWLADPENTSTTVCSTDKESLQLRIWADMVKYYLMHEGKLPGEYIKSKLMIRLGGRDAKSCIRGIAVLAGSVEDAKAHIIGVHNERNRLVIDEMQASLRAAVEAGDNLDASGEFKFLGIGNPESRLDLLGEFSEPVDGWDSISTENESWQTKRGKTLYFDGLKSPAIEEPERYFYLLSQRSIDELKRTKGEDSPAFWTMRRGFVPPEGLTSTVMTESLVVAFNIRDAAVWAGGSFMCAGVDPAFSRGGDNVIFFPAKIGMFESGVMGAEFQEPIKIKLKLSGGMPMTYYLAGQIIQNAKELGIGAQNLAIDITTSQRMLADVIEAQWKSGLHRVDFGGKTSEMPVSVDDARPANEVYDRRVTELYFNLVEFGRNDQIRGLCNDACKQLCQRAIVDKNLKKTEIVSKKKMKLLTGGVSPDEADAAVCVTDLMRVKLRIHPGYVRQAGTEAEQTQELQDNDIDGEDDLYGIADV